MAITINGTENGYNPLQVNENFNYSPDGALLSRSLMVNIRAESPKQAWKLFQEFKELIDGKKSITEEPKKTVRKKKVEQKIENPNPEKSEAIEKVCPRCQSALTEKRGISANGRHYCFLGCSSFPVCRYSQNIISKAEKEKALKQPADEDFVEIIKS